jgi:hypothetical protein
MRSRFLLAVLLSLPTAVLGRAPPAALQPPRVQETVAAPPHKSQPAHKHHAVAATTHKSQPAHKHHAVVAERRPLPVPPKDDSDQQLFRQFVEWQNENGKHAGE